MDGIYWEIDACFGNGFLEAIDWRGIIRPSHETDYSRSVNDYSAGTSCVLRHVSHSRVDRSHCVALKIVKIILMIIFLKYSVQIIDVISATVLIGVEGCHMPNFLFRYY